MDKLLAIHNKEYNEKTINKWYKFFLHILTFKKYRTELAAKNFKLEQKLTSLKNKKIVVK
jgi:hypothetical protein